MKHIASCSFGKDSIATVLLAIEHGEPLDEVAYCEVMFDDTISGEIPEHIDFIHEKAIPAFERHGIKTVVLRSGWTYVKHFTCEVTRGDSKGKIRGFPICGYCSICRDCKLPPIRQYLNNLPEDAVQYIGIAKDEQERLLRLDGKRISLLDKYGYTERDAWELCKRHGLLSPIYEFTSRGGCWFCPNAKEKELRHLYDHHKDLWKRMLELQALPNKVTELFNRTHRFSDIDYNFRLDDAQVTIYDLIGGELNENRAD
jgi:3'-phosphoadenosine 5'-phosphosulfate sulfotransferase (PAPS reductase)/FAD synthetase